MDVQRKPKLMEERRKHKDKNKGRYKEINKKSKETIELWLPNQCMEIESLEQKHNTFNLQKIEAITGRIN